MDCGWPGKFTILQLLVLAQQQPGYSLSNKDFVWSIRLIYFWMSIVITAMTAQGQALKGVNLLLAVAMILV